MVEPAGGPEPRATALWAPRAWTEHGWRERVLLQIGADGSWASVQPDTAAPPGVEMLAGPALPGMVNAHSHAFQRAFAGLAERREIDRDDFWSWRDRMYAVALRITPEQQQAVAAQLFVELLRGGFTHVCEFHYLHNDPGGTPYPGDGTTMARAIATAAGDAGIGLTLLPAVYERAGFAQAELREDQRRFRAGVRSVLAMRDALRADAPGAPKVGIALHSLRAVTDEAIGEMLAACDDAPIHIHAAEQTLEVDECLAATGLRPIEWLCRHAAPDQRWHLVHATHASHGEMLALARAGAGIVLCPSTEGNLGDGIVDLQGWLRQAVPLAIGSDSHATRSAPEELRLLEYSQRLSRRVRCVAAAPQAGQPSTAARLWALALDGGGRAAGFESWGLRAGARADLLVVDMDTPALLGIAPEFALDALTFSSPVRPFRDVMVAGRWVGRNHRIARADRIAQGFVCAMDELWGKRSGN